ncbi:MAG TPA: hypothetical protein VHR16_07490 [Candidatus Limnocylindrales bacterium]|jgi:hypothetical protein|nr:hypothetical protein [Candidatus Limnocylindrales bacterium]
MCLNCGCGQPNEDHGNAANITADDLRMAGEANDQSLRESAQHIVETVELLDASNREHQGLAQPAGPGGAGDAAPGTPATES